MLLHCQKPVRRMLYHSMEIPMVTRTQPISETMEDCVVQNNTKVITICIRYYHFQNNALPYSFLWPYFHTFLYQKLWTGAGELGVVLAHVPKHAEVVLGQDLDIVTILYPHQMVKNVLGHGFIQKDAILRHVVSFHSLADYQYMQSVDDFID